jgi:predicted transcriptional regulator
MGRIKLVAILVFCSVMSAVAAGEISQGAHLPSFTVRTGEGKTISSDSLAGKYVVIFYEPKEKTDLNRPIKTRLNVLYDSLHSPIKEQVVRFPVVDCSWAFWPFTGIWESELEKNAKREGMDIWGDWNGAFRREFGFEENEIYLVIIDNHGTVLFCQKGKLNPEQEDCAAGIIESWIASEAG